MNDDSVVYDRIEYTAVDDILECTTDTSHPVLLTKAALDGTPAEVVDCNRELVARSLDRAGTIEDLSRDSVRSSYVDLYRAAVTERGWAWYRDRVPRTARELALQGLKLIGAREHLDLVVRAIEEDLDDEAFRSAFDTAEAATALEAANAAFLLDLPTINVLSETDIETALSIEFSGEGLPADYPRWRGDLSIFE
ncbi:MULTISPECIES: hypothetical protein [Brevibacterium]|uniref:DNA mimic protein DMP19 C-terminal domain-containing protein n=1 Tax=Brevibacterium casei TaxID=33889 RepID=A0A7T3ZYR9_9MICO|nr:hypothetical protein [Brevibacterium casei]QQB14173.1 hypothetical protein I6H47_15635 [Brevibacterium casei]